MVTKQEISALIQESIKALNEEKAEDKKIPVSDDTRLLGSGTLMDSLDFIVVITSIEERVLASTGQNVELDVDLDTPEESNPYRDVGTLSAHIATMLD